MATNTINTGKNKKGSSTPSVSEIDTVAVDEKIRALDAKVERIDKKADEGQIKAIEALGIYVALFSFISVSIQVFSRISNAASAGLFILLIFCSLAILIVLIDILLNSTKVVTVFWKLDSRYWLIIALFILGAVAIGSVTLLKFQSLNPIIETSEFQNTLDNAIDKRIDRLKDENIKNSTDTSQKIMQDFKDCIKSTGSIWSCLK
jgi:hypothetical protein